MKRLYRNVGSRNPALQQRPEVFKAVGVYAAIYVLSRVVNDLMRVFACQAFIGEQGVSVESRASGDVLAHFILQYLPTATRNNGCADVSAALQDADHGSFV